jgi:uncharacterized protein (TIGR02172 family)
LIQIGQGRTADIFEYNEDTIIKLYKKDFPDDAINQEFINSRFVYLLGINTPQPLELTSIKNRKGIIYQRVSGSSLLRIIIKSPWAILKQSRKLASLHYKIHTHYGEGINRHQKEVLRDNIKTTQDLNDTEKEKILDYLAQLPDGNNLYHGDFHPDNVLVDNNVWIIDWMTGMSGYPIGDVARTVILLEYGTLPESTPAIIKKILNYLRNRLKDEYVKYYLKLSRRDISEIDQWILPMAAARLIEWIPSEEREKLLNMIRERLRAIS